MNVPLLEPEIIWRIRRWETMVFLAFCCGVIGQVMQLIGVIAIFPKVEVQWYDYFTLLGNLFSVLFTLLGALCTFQKAKAIEESLLPL
jgi:cytosine/uracil/thiamine/allantoin permease